MDDLDEKTQFEKKRKEVWDKSFHAFANSYLYGIRRRKIKKMQTIITFLGVIIPILGGSLILNYGSDNIYVKLGLAILSIISLIQVVLSTWSIVAGWNEANEFYTEASYWYSSISEEYESLAKTPPNKLKKLETEIKLIDNKNSYSQMQAVKYELSEKEKRRGMRYALRNFRRKCVGCGKVPTSMESTDCDICGDFNPKLRIFNRSNKNKKNDRQ